MAEAYAIQDEVSRALSPIVGWKVSYSPTGSDILTAPLYQETFITGSSLSITGLKQPLAEAEAAFRIRAPVTPGASDGAILENLQFVPLFEIVHSRYSDFYNVPPYSLLADNSAAGFIKIGTPVERWQDVSTDKKICRITADGRVVEEFNYAEKLNTAVQLALAVIHRKDGRERALPMGTIITTGSMVKPSILTGDIVADYGGLGANALTLRL